MICSTLGHGVSRELFEKYFNIFSPENIHSSILRQTQKSDDYYVKSGTFGFTRMIDVSPMETSFLATCSLLEKLLFSIIRWDRLFLDEMLDLLMESEDGDIYYNDIGRDKVRAVTRMLLLPSKSETNLLKRRLETGLGDAPFEALVMPHQDRLLSNIDLLHSVYSFIPRARAPPVSDALFASSLTLLSHMTKF